MGLFDDMKAMEAAQRGKQDGVKPAAGQQADPAKPKMPAGAPEPAMGTAAPQAAVQPVPTAPVDSQPQQAAQPVAPAPAVGLPAEAAQPVAPGPVDALPQQAPQQPTEVAVSPGGGPDLDAPLTEPPQPVAGPLPAPAAVVSRLAPAPSPEVSDPAIPLMSADIELGSITPPAAPLAPAPASRPVSQPTLAARPSPPQAPAQGGANLGALQDELAGLIAGLGPAPAPQATQPSSSPGVPISSGDIQSVHPAPPPQPAPAPQAPGLAQQSDPSIGLSQLIPQQPSVPFTFGAPQAAQAPAFVTPAAPQLFAGDKTFSFDNDVGGKLQLKDNGQVMYVGPQVVGGQQTGGAMFNILVQGLKGKPKIKSVTVPLDQTGTFTVGKGNQNYQVTIRNNANEGKLEVHAEEVSGGNKKSTLKYYASELAMGVVTAATTAYAAYSEGAKSLLGSYHRLTLIAYAAVMTGTMVYSFLTRRKLRRELEKPVTVNVPPGGVSQ